MSHPNMRILREKSLHNNPKHFNNFNNKTEKEQNKISRKDK